MFANGFTQAQILTMIQGKLLDHRRALDALHDVYGWSSGVAVADLVALGFSSADASTLLSAVADANAEYLIHATGLPPGTYPQPTSGYSYGATQNQVIGPQ